MYEGKWFCSENLNKITSSHKQRNTWKKVKSALNALRLAKENLDDWEIVQIENGVLANSTEDNNTMRLRLTEDEINYSYDPNEPQPTGEEGGEQGGEEGGTERPEY